jgi:hypothetical protein
VEQKPNEETMGKTEERLSPRKQHAIKQREQISELYAKHGGNVAAIAREMGLVRSTVGEHLKVIGIKKPLAGGKRQAKAKKEALPTAGSIKRYILTSAQNNTYVHKEFWANVEVMAQYYSAQILVGTFSYNQNNFGNLAVKRGTKKPYENKLWFDPAVTPYLSDEKIELAPGLVWCGGMNILPTEDNPISGLETYGGADSVIFPHAKIEMRSIATMPDMPVKMIYTTGAATLQNYIQRKLGIKAEHHHRYSFLLVEVDSEGNWWVRQVAARKNGRNIQDLNVVVEDGSVVCKTAKVEAITWGDLHATISQPEVVAASLSMLDMLRPSYQFIHDIMEGVSTNRHLQGKTEPHKRFHNWLRGLHRVDEELRQTRTTLEMYLRPWCKTIVPDSNHDGWWLHSWLHNYDYRYDPSNAELFLRLQNYMYEEIRKGKLPKNVNLTERAFVKETGLAPGAIKFLLPDESFEVKEVECGMHGHLGPNGSFGSPSNLAKIGKKATTAHTHSCGIFHGLYVAGTSSKLTKDWTYTAGPSSWSHSHVVLYSNGQRAIVTMKNGKWRA